MNKQSTLIKGVDGTQEHHALFSEYLLGDHNNNKQTHHLKPSTGENRDNTKKSTNTSRSVLVPQHEEKKSRLGKCNIGMVLLNVLLSLTLLSVFFLTQEPFNPFRSGNKDVLFSKLGRPFGGNGGDKELNDAKSAGLTFTETIVSVTGDRTLDLEDKPLLFSFQFKYSNGKYGTRFGGEHETLQSMGAESLILKTNEHINHITVYTSHRKIDNPWVKDGITELVVGIKFRTSFNQTKLFGTTDGHDTTESFENYILGYPQGKAVAHVDKVTFTWYRYCSKSDRIE